MESLVSLFSKEHGVFAKFLQFEAIALGLLIVSFFTFYFKKSYGFVIILLVFTCYIVNLYTELKDRKVTDMNKVTLIKLQKIQDIVNMDVQKQIVRSKVSQQDVAATLIKSNQLDSLYIDANIIHFMHSISILNEYNPQEFVLFAKGINNILKIRKEIEFFHLDNNNFPQNTAQMLESAIELKANTINNLHNFIYAVPKQNSMYLYIDSIIERYNVLITRNLDVIHRYYQEDIRTRGLNSQSRIVNYNQTKHFDLAENHDSVPHKLKHKLIQFYV
jgi:hypothetical protein